MTCTPEEFRSELSRLYAQAAGTGYVSDHLAYAAQVSQRLMVKWLGGYATPDEDERVRVLRAINKWLGNDPPVPVAR